MSLTTTTLSGAVAAQDTYFGVASASGIVNANFTVSQTPGQAVQYALVENEYMLILSVTGTVVTVLRGQLGTRAVAHGASAPFTFGYSSDFNTVAVPSVGAFSAPPSGQAGWSAPVAGGATNVATGPMFHLTGTTAMVNLTAYAGYVEGSPIRIVFDGSGSGLTWTAAGNIAVAGTATTAASYVDFVFDQGSAKWHPSRLA